MMTREQILSQVMQEFGGFAILPSPEPCRADLRKNCGCRGGK